VFLGNQSLQSLCDTLRLKAERPWARLVHHAAIAVNHVEPVGPARVGSLGGVVKCDYHCREFDSEFDHTDLTKPAALLEALWLRDDNLICEVASRAKDSLQSKMRPSSVLWKRPARLRSKSSP